MTITEAEIKRAHLGVTLSFLCLGLSAGNFVARIPDLKSKLELSNSLLGLCLLMMSLGVLVALGPVGKSAAKHGSSRTLVIATTALMVIAPTVGLANSALTLSIALFFFGMTVASQDVSMNTHGVTLEQKSGNRYMSRFHAFWSVGGLFGSIAGGLFAQAEIGVFLHFAVISIVIAAITIYGSPLLLAPDADKHVYSEENLATKKKKPALIFIMGLLGMAASVGEGSAGDWGGVLARETFGASAFVSTIPFIAFSFTMVVGRFFGDQLATKFGPNRILKVGGLIGGTGLAAGLLVGGTGGVIFGWFLFGAALSAVIPLLFSAAGSMANKRFAGSISPAEAVAMISGISYFGFIVGPPLMGFVADLITLRWAMLIPAVLAIIISASSKIFTSE
jgi:MFS family permease